MICNKKRLAVILNEIADDVQEEIKMEADYPSKNCNKKLAILDMNVWMNNESKIVYQHYEKEVASKQILSAKSAQSGGCKKSVHVQELVRRILNTSTHLDWDDSFVPVLNDYMVRMRLAGYFEQYRKRTLLHSDDNQKGIRPLHRPRCWKQEERRINKRKKKYNWSSKGGCIAPICIPATPHGELARELREIAEKETELGLKFKIVEMGGRTIKNEVFRRTWPGWQLPKNECSV
jgi:hypothetical protein